MDAVKPGYLAGFFDADGAVGITRGSGTSYFLLWVRINGVDPAPLLLFKQKYGGKVQGPYNRGGNHRPIYHWAAEAKTAEAFLRDVVGDLVVKRERVIAALEFRELFKKEFILPRGLHKNEAKRAQVIELREAAYQRMKVANKRGVA